MTQLLNRATRPRLGEELPIFCEKCGYSLHGLPQVRCESCSILQFHCPECGHHQPINTLRPAAIKLIGRVQALMLAIGVFFRLNFFGWLFVAWWAMGMEWSYQYHYTSNRGAPGLGGYTTTLTAGPSSIESMLAHALFGLAFGLVGRMLLLRWKWGWAVGAILGALVIIAVAIGAQSRQWDLNSAYSPFTTGYLYILLIAGTTTWAGALVVWPIWCGIVRLFVPRRWADALLDWQQWKEARTARLGL